MFRISDYGNAQENPNEITKNLAFPRNAITSISIPAAVDNKPLSQLLALLLSAVESVVGTVHKQCLVGQSLKVVVWPLAPLEATGSLLKRQQIMFYF